jgi:hypothetical protein
VKLGGAAFGWSRTEATDSEGRRLVVGIDAEAETVRRIVGLRAEGFSLRHIAATLIDEGRPTKRGGEWAPTTVRKILARATA